jgi:hypothetical protein
MRTTWPTHLILRDFITLIIFSEAYKLLRSSLYSLLQLLDTFFLLGQNIISINLFCSLSVRDQVLHPHKATE